MLTRRLLLPLAALVAATPVSSHPRKRKKRQRPPTYLVRVYDYTDRYRDAVAYAADYYQQILGGAGVVVEYHPMEPLSIDRCTATATPEIGIRACEELNNGGTAGSTGMDWREVSQGRWELFSNQYYNADPSYGLGGRFLTCHEFGHSFGNLPHRPLGDEPYSCMSATGGYDWDTLIPPEIAQIISLLPGAAKA